MKKIGIVAAVVVSTVIVGGQAKTNKVVEANEFRLLDGSGKVRAEITLSSSDFHEPTLLFRDADGNTDVELGASTSHAYLHLGKSESVEHISLDTSGIGQTLTLGNVLSKSDGWIMLGAGKFTNSISMEGSAGEFAVNLDETFGPKVRLADKEGYEINLGRTDLQTVGTGRKTQTPAASVVLFGKDKKVLWSAP